MKEIKLVIELKNLEVNMKKVAFVLLLLNVFINNSHSQDSFGPDQITCENVDHINIPCVGNGDWSDYYLIENGDGYFDGYAPFMCPWSLDYHPGPGDIENGYVDFCLLLYDNLGMITFYDCITYNFQELPIINAGEDQTIMEGDIASLAAFSENYAEVMWSTNGDGFFEDEWSLETDY
nr:hypothetical protein [Bacteroidota bacterium]